MASKFEITGRVNYVNSGIGKNSGEAYQMVKVSGFTFFLPEQHRNGWKQGQEIQISGEYTGDRYSKKTDTYTPQFEIEGILLLSEGLPAGSTLPV